MEGYEEKILPFISNYRLNLFDYYEYEEFGGFREQGITSLIKEYKLSREGAMEKVALYW